MDIPVTLFSKLMAYVLLWEQQCLAGGLQRPYERVRQDIASLLQEQEEAAAAHAIAVEHVLAARLAVLAWTDEVALRHKILQYHDRWQASPLQAEYYGPGFPETAQHAALQQLFASEPVVREVYTLCLSLGFSGRRGSRLADRVFLTNVPSVPGHNAPLQHDDVWAPGFTLTPQPYTLHPPAARGRRMAGALVGSVGAAGLLWWLWMVWPPSPPMCVPSPTLLPTLQQHLAAQPCSQISAAVQACVVTLAGRIEAADQRTALRNLVQGLQGVQRLEDHALHVVPKPFCEVLGLFASLSAAGAPRAGTLSVRPNKAGEPPRYLAGEDFMLEVTTPTQFASYLYVDFYESAGLVRYLYSNQTLGQPLAPGSTQMLGMEDGKPIWGIGPPYGRGLVTVIASETPLVFPPPETSGTRGSVASYLKQLQQALAQKDRETGVDAAYLFIETRTP